MVDVNAWVVCLDGAVYAASFHVSSNDIDAHLQRYHLLVVEDIFNDDDISVFAAVGILPACLLSACF